MAKVKLTSKVDSEVLVVGLATSNKKLQIESGASQIDSASLLATLNAMGATGKADEVCNFLWWYRDWETDRKSVV